MTLISFLYSLTGILMFISYMLQTWRFLTIKTGALATSFTTLGIWLLVSVIAFIYSVTETNDATFFMTATLNMAGNIMMICAAFYNRYCCTLADRKSALEDLAEELGNDPDSLIGLQLDPLSSHLGAAEQV